MLDEELSGTVIGAAMEVHKLLTPTSDCTIAIHCDSDTAR